MAEPGGWMRKGTPPPPELLTPVADADAARLPESLHARALAAVHYEYETIFDMAGLPLAVFNREALRYPRPEDVIREYTARASAVAASR